MRTQPVRDTAADRADAGPRDINIQVLAKHTQFSHTARLNASTDHVRGFWAAFGAFLLWGLLPLYWKLLQQIPALEIMLHRVIWCFVSVAMLLCLRHGLSWLDPVRRQPRLLLGLAASGSLISLNWYLYIWAVNNAHVVETSLGYYINPLVNVALGTLLLGERLKPVQIIAVGIAGLGVLYLTIVHGRLPWIALALAFSFAAYGFIRKQLNVDAIAGLALEAATVVGFALGLLAYLHGHGQAVAMTAPLAIQLLLLLGGLVTAVPLILFAFAARRIPYSTLGMLQYLAPTIQLLLGVFVFQENFDRDSLLGFACIWLALSLYTYDGIRRMAHSARLAPGTR